MKAAFFLWRRSSEDKMLLRFTGSPVCWILVLLALVLVSGFAWCVVKYLHDAYFPYEGEVVAIRTSWLERFVLESVDDDHLTVRTSGGKIIDRIAPMQVRIMNGIDVGDHIVKERGFRNRVRLLDERPVRKDPGR